MGKGMLKGLVPYRDLFEQKGPLIFLMHSAAYLIDRTGFLGVFVFEIINMTLVLLLTRADCPAVCAEDLHLVHCAGICLPDLGQRQL